MEQIGILVSIGLFIFLVLTLKLGVKYSVTGTKYILPILFSILIKITLFGLVIFSWYSYGYAEEITQILNTTHLTTKELLDLGVILLYMVGWYLLAYFIEGIYTFGILFPYLKTK